MADARRFMMYHLPAILYAGMVIGLSSIPHLKGPSIDILAADKIAHFVEYGLFAILIYRSFSNFTSACSPGRAFLLSALFVILFAALDENYQRFVPGRQFDVYDLLTDTLGAILVLLLLWIRKRKARTADV